MAVSATANMPSDFGTSLTDASGRRRTYSSLTYLLVTGNKTATRRIFIRPGHRANVAHQGEREVIPRKWNAPKIAALNPGANLPATDIVVAHRSDGSGTSYIFTDYLSKVSPAWASGVGKSTAVKWPVGLGGKGNEGVTALVQQTPGSIGYIELIYALTNHIPFADLKNHDGNWVKASLDGVTAAASGAAANMPADFRVSITDATGANAYPISSFTYLLVYQQQSKRETGEQVKRFLNWALHAGQQYATALNYAPLPAQVVELEGKQLDTIELPAK